MESQRTTTWKDYEEVARHLLNEIATEFGLGHVEGKQLVSGESGTAWEIDAKGVLAEGDGFLVIECRRYPSSRISQEEVGGIAFKITDTGAAGGILVTPVGLQAGAKHVAAHSNIREVTLDANSSTTDYVLKFLNQIFVGFSSTAHATGTFDAEVINPPNKAKP